MTRPKKLPYAAIVQQRRIQLRRDLFACQDLSTLAQHRMAAILASVPTDQPVTPEMLVAVTEAMDVFTKLAREAFDDLRAIEIELGLGR